MKKYISIVLAVVLLLSVFTGCGKKDDEDTRFDLKAGDVFTVRVSMEESGIIKSMALTIYSDDETFEILDGKWLNHQAVIADFNRENKDAAIAFKDDTNYYGEIFEFTVKAKKDVTVIDEVFSVEAVLKNNQSIIQCNGISLSYIVD